MCWPSSKPCCGRLSLPVQRGGFQMVPSPHSPGSRLPPRVRAGCMKIFLLVHTTTLCHRSCSVCVQRFYRRAEPVWSPWHPQHWPAPHARVWCVVNDSLRLSLAPAQARTIARGGNIFPWRPPPLAYRGPEASRGRSRRLPGAACPGMPCRSTVGRWMGPSTIRMQAALLQVRHVAGCNRIAKHHTDWPGGASELPGQPVVGNPAHGGMAGAPPAPVGRVFDPAVSRPIFGAPGAANE